jgi:hypothetical protein
MNEPRGPGRVVSWREAVTGVDVDWLVRRSGDAEFPWLSMGSGEHFCWDEIVDMAARAGAELIVWARVPADACVLDGGDGSQCPGCKDDQDGVIQDLRSHWRA